MLRSDESGNKYTYGGDFEVLIETIDLLCTLHAWLDTFEYHILLFFPDDRRPLGNIHPHRLVHVVCGGSGVCLDYWLYA